jgi:hypothetical protein
MRTRLLAVTTVAVLTWFSAAAQAAAQVAPADPGTLPIGRFAVDARAVFPRFKQDATIASGIGVSSANLPTHGLGVVVGAHWYPMHLGIVTFGVGGELLLTRASRTLAPTTEGGEPGPTVDTRFSSLSPQVSFNFGKQNGWSYISGGIGRSTYTAEREDAPLPDADAGSKTINYGGGARWFAKKHLALSVDLRFYAINPAEAAGGRPALPRQKLVMLSAGASFK